MINRTIPDVTLKTRIRDEAIDRPQPVSLAGFQRSARLSQARRWWCSRCQAPSPRPAATSNARITSGSTTGLPRRRAWTEVYCISVNDAFVMYQWGKNLGLKNVKLLPDGSGDFTRRMGMLIDKEPSRLRPAQLALWDDRRGQHHHPLVRRARHQRSRAWTATPMAKARRKRCSKHLARRSLRKIRLRLTSNPAAPRVRPPTGPRIFICVFSSGPLKASASGAMVTVDRLRRPPD